MCRGLPWHPLTPLLWSLRFPGHPILHSRLPVPFREIINGITVTDENNNELGHSRVSLGMGMQAGAGCCRGSPAGFACRGQQ